MSNLKIFTDNIEPEALNQIYTLVKQPAFSNAKVRIMPDVHAGKGCVIGFTADLGEKVIPNIVGVDIGCGMLATKIEKGAPYSYIDFIATDTPIIKGIQPIIIPTPTPIAISTIEKPDTTPKITVKATTNIPPNIIRKSENLFFFKYSGFLHNHDFK